MSEFAEVRAIAPAKVNLQLEVRGRREDGYHELSTVMAALELADELTVRRSKSGEIQLAVEGPQASADIPDDSRNLVWRAARAVLDRGLEENTVPPDTGLELRLLKQIPSGAGLGGGSSDAAAAVLAVEELLGLSADSSWRRGLLARLGADCVFFHDVGNSGIARCEGVGEQVTAIEGERPGWTISLLTPQVHASTAEVYAAVDRQVEERVPCSFGSEDLADGAVRMRARLASDLEPAALRAVPELREWRRMLDESGAEHLRLSGSGSTFFGLHESEGEARQELERLLALAAERGLRARFSASTRIRAGGATLCWER